MGSREHSHKKSAGGKGRRAPAFAHEAQAGRDPLESYAALIDLIDGHVARLVRAYGSRIACRRGCSACCILGTVNAIEAHVLIRAVRALPARVRASLGRRLERGGERPGCVLLSRGACLVYESRPVICRTHGYPVLADGAVDVCPLNFRGVEELAPSYVLDLERLNTALAAMDVRFRTLIDEPFFDQDRIPVSDLVERALSACPGCGSTSRRAKN